MKNRPLLVAFEGPDGCGKTTLLRYVQEELDSEGIFSVTVNMVPEGPIREMLLNSPNLSPKQQLLLLGCAEIQVAEEIRNHLAKGRVVFLDRTPISRRVYQGKLHNLTVENNLMTNLVTGGFPNIDLLLYLSLSPEEASRRLLQRAGGVLDEIEKTVEARREYIHQLYKEEIDAEISLNEHLKKCGAKHSDTVIIEAEFPIKMQAAVVKEEILSRLN